VTSHRGVDALGVGAAKVAVSVSLFVAGFRAVSDDDYARIVIAQRFAEAPALDPSGTSWLPLPFWVYGLAFRLFGGTLEVARGVAVLGGVAAVLLIWLSARWVGASRAGAVLAGLLAAVFPWSAWLGAAALPEAPAAGLVVLALAGTTRDSMRDRWLSALAIAAACLARYEAWPVALVVALSAVHDGRRRRSPALFGVALLALSAIVLWLAHGQAVHGDALFFFRRVAAYRQALGADGSPATNLLGPLRALVVDAPEVVVALAAVLARGGVSRALLRPALGALALVVFLVLGELGGGGPTHHAARALLAVWYLGTVAVGEAAGRLVERGMPRALSLGAPLGLALVALLAHAPFPSDFADRRHALTLGTRARELSAPGLFVDTPDFAHLAVAAAFGRPSRVVPFDDRDPRHPRASDPFESAAALRSRTSSMPDAWLVVTRPHGPVALELGISRAEAGELLLVEPRREPD